MFFAAVVLASCVATLIAIRHSRSLLPAPEVCWHCPTVFVVLGVVVFMAAVQLVVAAALPAVLLPKLLKRTSLTLLFWISVFASMVNAFLPAKAGTGAKAILFKRFLHTDYTAFGTSHILASVVSLFVSLLVVSVFSWRYVVQAVSDAANKVDAISGWSTVLTILAALFVGFVIVARSRWVTLTRKAVLERSGGVLILVLIFLISFLQVALIGGRAMAAAHLFGVVPAWEMVVFLGATLSLVPLVSFVPGGVGIREAVFVWAGLVAGIPIDVSLSAALVDRIVGTVLVSFLGGVGLRQIIRRTVQERSLSAT